MMPDRVQMVTFLVALGLTAVGAPAAVIPVEGWDSGAIAAAIARSGPGDTVQLHRGQYTITEPITPRTGTKLQGAGQDLTVVRFVGDQPGVMLSLAGCEDVEVCGFTLDAGGSPLVHQGISAYNCRRLNLHHLTIRNLGNAQTWGPHGILFTGDSPTYEHGVTDSVIADCSIENIAPESAWGAGVRLAWGSSRNQVLRCRIYNTGRGGILTNDRSTELVIRDNRVGGSHGEMLGIEVWGGCDRSVIEDNIIDHWLSIGGCDWCAARRNVISCTDGSFGFIGIEAIGSYLVVTDNVVDDGQIIGLSLSGAQPKQYHYYADNVFRRCSQWGAQLQGEAGGCSYLYLYRCRFVENTVGRGHVWYPGDEGNGFRVNGNTTNMVLEECDMSGNERHGIQVTVGGPDGWSFQRCTIRDNAGCAYIGPPALETAEWVDCVVEGNASDALPPAGPFAAPPPVCEPVIPQRVKVGETVQFAVGYQGDESEMREALWDFGDGPPAAGAQVEHTYQRPGNYRVTVVVWNQAGRAKRVSRDLVVVGR